MPFTSGNWTDKQLINIVQEKTFQYIFEHASLTAENEIQRESSHWNLLRVFDCFLDTTFSQVTCIILY